MELQRSRLSTLYFFDQEHLEHEILSADESKIEYHEYAVFTADDEAGSDGARRDDRGGEPVIHHVASEPDMGSRRFNEAMREGYHLDYNGNWTQSTDIDPRLEGRVREVICPRTHGDWHDWAVPDGSDDDHGPPNGLSLTAADLAAMGLHAATLQYTRRITTESRFWQGGNNGGGGRNTAVPPRPSTVPSDWRQQFDDRGVGGAGPPLARRTSCRDRVSLILSFSANPPAPLDFVSLTYDVATRTTTVLVRQSMDLRDDSAAPPPPAGPPMPPPPLPPGTAVVRDGAYKVDAGTGTNQPSSSFSGDEKDDVASLAAEHRPAPPPPPSRLSDEYSLRLSGCRSHWAHPFVLPVVMLQVQFSRTEEAVAENAAEVSALERDVGEMAGFQGAEKKRLARSNSSGTNVSAAGAAGGGWGGGGGVRSRLNSWRAGRGSTSGADSAYAGGKGGAVKGRRFSTVTGEARQVHEQMQMQLHIQRQRQAAAAAESAGFGGQAMTVVMKRAHDVLKRSIKLLDTIRWMGRAVRIMLETGDELEERVQLSGGAMPGVGGAKTATASSSSDASSGPSRWAVEDPLSAHWHEIRQYLEGLRHLCESLETDRHMLELRCKAQIDIIYSKMAQEDNNLNARMAVASSRDSSSMKALAVVTAIFLPGEYIGTLFGMSMFDWTDLDGGDGGDGASSAGPRPPVLTHLFWVYWALTIPLTVIILCLWRGWWVSQDRHFRQHLSAELSQERYWTDNGRPRPLERSFLYDFLHLSVRRAEDPTGDSTVASSRRDSGERSVGATWWYSWPASLFGGRRRRRDSAGGLATMAPMTRESTLDSTYGPPPPWGGPIGRAEKGAVSLAATTSRGTGGGGMDEIRPVNTGLTATSFPGGPPKPRPRQISFARPVLNRQATANMIRETRGAGS